jgi:CubicO group peptidase (beta-lactamase class C family)
MTTQLAIHDPRTTPLPTRRRRQTAAACIAALAGAGLFAITVPAAGADVHARDAARPVGPRLQAILDRAVRAPETTFPGVALYVRRPGHETWSGAAGKANIDTARRMRATDRFRAGSIMKPFIAAATLQLEPGTLPAGRGIAHRYELVNGRLVDVTDIDSSMAGAAGGNALLTSIQDLSRFLRGLLAGRLFQRKETVTEMRSFVAAEDPDGLVGYGLGLERYVLPGGVEIIGHMGTAGGYRALMFYLPAQHIELDMVLNNPDDPTPVLLPALKLLLAEAS